MDINNGPTLKFDVENGQLVGGTVEMEMNKLEGPGHEKDNGLINHLKGPDFFDVKKFVSVC